MIRGINILWKVVFFFVFLCFLFHSIPAPARPDFPRRVFILHSYEAGNVCGQPQHDGIIMALREAGFRDGENLEIRTYHMDTKRKNNTPELIREQGRLAMKEVLAFRPHILVTLDDNAFRTVGLDMADSPTAVVFCGMNNQPEAYNRSKPFMTTRACPGHNITGVYEKLHFADALRVHANLFADLKKVRILLDSSPTGQAIVSQIRLETEKETLPCVWDMVVARSWEHYQREILKVNEDKEIGAIYPAALLLKDTGNVTYTAPEIFAWTVKHSRKTEIAVNYGFTRMGLFGGAAVDFYAMGAQAGRIAARILNGEPPGDIPIEDAERYALVFNLNRAEQLGVKIPADVLMAADEVILDKP